MARVHSHETVCLAGTTDDRPDPPTLDGEQCQVAGCTEPARVLCWSEEWSPRHGEWFLYCEAHADEKTDEHPDLEVVEDG